MQAVKNEVYINNALLFSFDDMSKAIYSDQAYSGQSETINHPKNKRSKNK